MFMSRAREVWGSVVVAQWSGGVVAQRWGDRVSHEARIVVVED